MGKGDKKSRRGKIVIGSYGVRRPKLSKRRGVEKIETAVIEAVEKVKKITEKPKAEPKSKVKVTEELVVNEPVVIAATEKVVKKVVKKPKAENIAE